jgi:hypothetical protein
MDGSTAARRSVSRSIPSFSCSMSSLVDHTHTVIEEVHTTGTIYRPGDHRIVSMFGLVLADLIRQ